MAKKKKAAKVDPMIALIKDLMLGIDDVIKEALAQAYDEGRWSVKPKTDDEEENA